MKQRTLLSFAILFVLVVSGFAQDKTKVLFHFKFDDNIDCGNPSYTTYTEDFTAEHTVYLPKYETGKFGKAIKFDSNYYLRNTGTGFNHTESYSVSLFFKFDDTGFDADADGTMDMGHTIFHEFQGDMLASKALVTKPYGLQGVSGLTDEVRVVGVANGSVVSGSWHHLVLVFDVVNQVRYVYFDGVKQATERQYLEPSAGGATLDQVIGDWHIGANKARGSLVAFQGLVDDFFVIREVLTEANIAKIAAEGAASLFSGVNVKSVLAGKSSVFAVDGDLYLNSSELLNGVSVDVCSASGQQVAKVALGDVIGKKLIVSGLNSGVYIVNVSTEEGAVASKVMIR